ncbi:MAG TPA: hypothetical protein VH740_14025 [Vicinamibacterales bacterium]|jgi:hypothetical protein
MTTQCILAGILVGSLAAAPVLAQHTAPKTQPPQASEPSAPTGELVLGTARIPHGVTADGKPLAAGTYQVKLTPQEAGPSAVGISESLERWVEFIQGGSVKGREVASIVPAAEIKLVAKDTPPPPNGVKVQMLKGNDYLRVWFNKGGNHVLVNLPVAAGAAPAAKAK